MAASSEPKNIVLCFDGTGDWATKHFTNVMKLYQRLDRQTQAVFYSGGVGTLGSPIALSKWRRAFLKLLDLATATSLRDRVLDGYSFIAREYEEGSRIYLFGFSRGAFTARLVASLVHNFGILEPRNLHLAPYLWQSISDLRTIGEFKNDARIIRQQFGRGGETKVHLMGLFDTVSSVGVFERFQVFPYTDKNPSVETILHAVSLDERRSAFPELLIMPDGNHVEEVWFPGVHRDIGGGCAADFGLENDTLQWMLSRLEHSGLALRDASIVPSPKKVHLPFFDPYVFVGLYPQLMFDYTLADRRHRNFSLWRPWAWFGDRPKDPGFRYFWPNFKHVRRPPQNGFVFEAPDRPISGPNGTKVSPEQVQNVEDPVPAPRPALPEFVGTMLGVALAALIGNSTLQEPIWPSWPHPWALWGTLTLFGLFMVHQGVSQWLESKPALRFLSRGIVPIGLLATVGFGMAVWSQTPWPALPIALGIGAVAGLFATAGPRPCLIAQRAVPPIFFPWLAIAGLSWLGGLLIGAPVESLEAGGPVWVGLAAWGFLSGLLQIVQDRMKMRHGKAAA